MSTKISKQITLAPDSSEDGTPNKNNGMIVRLPPAYAGGHPGHAVASLMRVNEISF
jgi:hypothetical protein